jgi:hypothetical protein
LTQKKESSKSTLFFGKGAKLALINKLKIMKCNILFNRFGEIVVFFVKTKPKKKKNPFFTKLAKF